MRTASKVSTAVTEMNKNIRVVLTCGWRTSILLAWVWGGVKAGWGTAGVSSGGRGLSCVTSTPGTQGLSARRAHTHTQAHKYKYMKNRST